MTRLYFLTFLLTACFLLSTCKSKGKKEANDEKNIPEFIKTGSVERFSPLMDEIIPPGEIPEILADGFIWAEGPVWLPDQDILLFSDIPNNSVFQWSEQEGLKLYLKPAGYTDTVSRGGETGSNGLLLDLKGNLVLCQHGDRRIAQMDAPLDNG